MNIKIYLYEYYIYTRIHVVISGENNQPAYEKTRHLDHMHLTTSACPVGCRMQIRSLSSSLTVFFDYLDNKLLLISINFTPILYIDVCLPKDICKIWWVFASWKMWPKNKEYPTFNLINPYWFSELPEFDDRFHRTHRGSPKFHRFRRHGWNDSAGKKMERARLADSWDSDLEKRWLNEMLWNALLHYIALFMYIYTIIQFNMFVISLLHYNCWESMPYCIILHQFAVLVWGSIYLEKCCGRSQKSNRILDSPHQNDPPEIISRTYASCITRRRLPSFQWMCGLRQVPKLSSQESESLDDVMGCHPKSVVVMVLGPPPKKTSNFGTVPGIFEKIGVIKTERIVPKRWVQAVERLPQENISCSFKKVEAATGWVVFFDLPLTVITVQ